jgi:hypothetical protein
MAETLRLQQPPPSPALPHKGGGSLQLGPPILPPGSPRAARYRDRLADGRCDTVVVYVSLTLEIRRGSAICLIPVLLAGWHLGLVPALVAAAAGVLAPAQLFFAPYYSFFVARPGESQSSAVPWWLPR